MRQIPRDLAARGRILSKPSVHQVLKSEKFHTFKPVLVHALNDDDPERMIEFRDWITAEMGRDPLTRRKIHFSDESVFDSQLPKVFSLPINLCHECWFSSKVPSESVIIPRIIFVMF